MPFYMYYGMDTGLWIALIAVFILGLVASAGVQSTFSKYAKVRARANIPAHIVAERLLQENGEGHNAVRVTPVSGSLTDHFNPKTNTVGLSDTVYNDTSVAALAVAAHEIGHVMQYQQGYSAIKIRNAILPVANLGSQAAPFIVLIGLLLNAFNVAFIGVVLFLAVFLFQLITLPVEFNASRRSIAMLQSGGYITAEEAPAAKKVLQAAAFTYVVAALSSLVTLLRLLSMTNRTKRN